jgi:hypothetical protein
MSVFGASARMMRIGVGSVAISLSWPYQAKSARDGRVPKKKRFRPTCGSIAASMRR